MSAAVPTGASFPVAAEVWIVGVSWQAPAPVMAPFVVPRQGAHAAGSTAGLIAAALDDAGSLPVAETRLFVVSAAAVTADLPRWAGGHGAITRCTTVTLAVCAAMEALRTGAAAACLVGASGEPGQTSGAWLVLETAVHARARGAAAYAAITQADFAQADSAASVAVGWLELPAGEKAASLTTPSSVPKVVLTAALRSAALAGAEEPGVRETLALVRAALALGHKVLPLVQLPASAAGAAVIAPLPWVHPLPLPGHPAARVPRRAGWLAASGQPAYFLLEEVPAAPARPDAVPFDHELCVFGAESPAELHAQLVALHQRLRAAQSSGAGLELVGVAYQTAAALPGRATYRLALVTGSLVELDRQLQELIVQLAPATAAAVQASHRPGSGIYCGSGSRGADAGATAFLFPGLGASYPHMLGDLCLHFPAVREVFDSIDFVAAALGENTAPSQRVFPRPGADAETTATGAAVITLLMAEWALAQLLRELGVVPDALMGCSTGEFAALCQGGSIDEVAALPIIYRLSLGVERGLPAAQLAALQSVLVAAAAESLTPLLSAAPGPLYVSADLGTDCALLVGERSTVAWLLAALETRGVAAHGLPVGIPYHTPLLNSATVRGAAELSALTVGAPRLPVWSCATARPYPADPAAILGDASVLFVRAIALRDTVEAMYQSGVRTFLEVGPGEGLGRRVSAILRGRPHVALASNVQQRTGVAQLVHLLAALHAMGHPLTLAPLFHRRHAAARCHPERQHAAAAVEATKSAGPRPPYVASRASSAALTRSGTALPAVTLSLPRSERWSCLRVDHWELLRAGGNDGIDPAVLFSATELQRSDAHASGAASLLCAWAAKRAVQGLVHRLTRREVTLPAIELATTPDDATRATGTWSTALGGALTVATAGCADAAVALVAAADLGVRIGVQISKARALPVNDAQTAVYRALFPSQRPATPAQLEIVAVDPWTGGVGLHVPGRPTLVHSRATQLGAYFVTVAVLPDA